MASISKKYDADDSNNVTGVSRSGRICKKSSKLIHFDSDIRVNKSNRTQVSKSREKSKRSKKITENMNAQHQVEISNDCSTCEFREKNEMQSSKEVLCYESNSMKSKSNMDDTQLNNSETDSSSTVTNNELLTPDYTSYDEDSVESDDKFLIPKHDLPIPQQRTENYSNMLLETKTNLCPQNYAYTGYKLWSSGMKVEIFKKYPNMDATILTIRLGEMWTQMSVENRNSWHERAQRLTAKADSFRKLCVMEYVRRPFTEEETSRPFKLQAIDIAAHLSLLGESLILIGTKIKQQDKPVSKSDYTTALMDSLLCAMASLLCLTQQNPLLKTDNPDTFLKTLDNIAYIMPGL